MPDTSKAAGTERAPLKTDEPGIGAKKPVRPSLGPVLDAQDAKTSAEGASQNLEAFPERKADGPAEDDGEEHKSASRFASGADSAVLTLSEEDQEQAEPNEDEAPSGPNGEEGFLAVWDDLEAIRELSADEALDDEEKPYQSLENGEGQRTLSEIAAASSALQPLDGSDDADLSSKHDELAEVVKAALVSMYGENAASASDEKALPLTPGPAASGHGWADDNLSPQDVILNYFDYESREGKSHRQFSDYLDGRAGAPVALGDPEDLASSRYRPHWAAASTKAAYEDDAASFPEGQAAHPGEEAKRESGRLLSAAAIGLVGGIAIAASLAVFVINSYGPSDRQGASASQAPEPADAGYGRWFKRSAEPETPKAGSPSAPGAAPVIAASDVFVTAGQPCALAIDVKPEPSNENSLISIDGVPEGARLNAGVDAGGGNWLLPPRRLAGLTISVPAGAPETVLLDVQIIDGNMRTPLSETKRFALHMIAGGSQPALPAAANPAMAGLQSAPSEAPFAAGPQPPARAAPTLFSTETVQAASPPPAAAGLPAKTARQAALQAEQTKAASKTEIEDLIREGNRLMRDGDILEARRIYQKAAAQGDPEAALAMGRSYDPVYFARIDKKNADPNAAKAFDWYRKAIDSGAGQTAKLRIENLKHFLNQ